MSISDHFPEGGGNIGFDYVIVGGGTAGCVIASRLSAYLPTKKILMIEGGPSDVGDNRALILKDRSEMLGTDLDFGYTSVEQKRGNSNLLHSRAKILGGCSSHNDMVSFRTPQYDAYTWEKLGCEGWNYETFRRVQDKLRLNTLPSAHPRDQNQLSKDWIASASRALHIPYAGDLNKLICSSEGLSAAAGWTPLSYYPHNGHRSSSSVAYIHPILRGEESRPNLFILTNAWVSRVNVRSSVATSVDVSTKDGAKHTVSAHSEIIICAGAFDTPRLLLLSGIGPKEHLESVGIPLVKDVPGVGENLMDHPGATVVFDLHANVPAETATHSDVLAFIRHKPFDWAIDDGNIPDILLHTWQLDNSATEQEIVPGYANPRHPFGIYPLALRPKSRGRVYLKSSNPLDKPALDFKYFEDENNYDAEILVAGIKAARKIAQTEPFKGWIQREVCPGPEITSDVELEEYARATSCTIFHPACTAKMGNVDTDPMAVVDPCLRLKGMANLRIADASVFPSMVSVNVMLTVLAVAERAAELIAGAAGWTSAQSRL